MTTKPYKETRNEPEGVDICAAGSGGMLVQKPDPFYLHLNSSAPFASTKEVTGKSSEHQRRSAATPTRESPKNRGDGWLRRGLGPSFGLRGNTKNS